MYFLKNEHNKLIQHIFYLAFLDSVLPTLQIYPKFKQFI